MTEPVVHSGKDLGIFRDFPVELLARIEPGLFLDVGAAYGQKTSAMLRASPASRLIAFEPFPGNLPSLRALAASDPRVTVRPVAVGAQTGSAKLFVPSKISSAFEKVGLPTGGSVVGTLKRRPLRRAEEVHEVPLVRLDDEIDEPVRFLKMDIQGSEYAALMGARRLFAERGVDYAYIEFNGDRRVLNFLARHGYTIFDCSYMAWPSRFVLRHWFRRSGRWRPQGEVLAKLHLTNGMTAYRYWPKVPFRSFACYCVWFAYMRLFVSGLQTDLFCVHRSKRNAFAQACVDARGSMRKPDPAKG